MTVRKDAVSVACGCGCGDSTSPGRRFVTGHNFRAHRRPRQIVEGMLFCPKCERDKPVDEFPRKGNYRNGEKRYGYCKPCHSAYQRTQTLRRRFNLTPEDYEALLTTQDGLCAVCLRPPGKMRLAVDHDHRSGLVRGLLCPTCNYAIGFWKDDVDRLDRAVQYLMRPPAVDALRAARFCAPGRSQGPSSHRFGER